MFEIKDMYTEGSTLKPEYEKWLEEARKRPGKPPRARISSQIMTKFLQDKKRKEPNHL